VVTHLPAPVVDTPLCVTGLGWVTPFGADPDHVWGRLTAGDSAVAPLEAPPGVRVRSPLAAVVASVASLPPGERQQALALDALRDTYATAGLDPHDPEVALVLGTSYGGDLDDPTVGSLADWAHQVARAIGHPGTPVSLATACSAGSDAVLVGAELVRSGAYRAAVCGGVDVVTLAKRLGHSALGTMTPQQPRPFDVTHSGMVLGEGAAFLAVESHAGARDRAAPVLARLRGAGSANDAAGLTAPDPDGESVVLAVRRCLAGSGLTTADVAVVSAHATATEVNDAVEATSLGRLFGDLDPGPVVFATKSALGHSLGACGAIEAITVILALRAGVAAPVAGLRDPVPFPLPLVAGTPARLRGRAGLSLTLGFGGFNTALLFALEGDSDA
jgi:3-oxoacyl-[acyl-carrier-protein] synthase II